MYQDVRKKTVRDYVIALIAFGILSVGLAWTVRIKAPVQQNAAERRNSRIIAISRDPNECQPNHRQLVKWLPVLDPSRIAMLQANGPYESDDWISNRQPLGLRPQPLPPKRILFESTPDYVFPFRQPVLTPPQPLIPGGLIAESQWPIPPSMDSIPVGVHWFRGSMIPLKSPPKLPSDDGQAPDESGRAVCVMEVFPPREEGHMPRVRLERRSEMPEFDRAVVKYCIRWLRRRTFEDDAFKIPRTVTVIWIFDGKQENRAPADAPKPGTPKPGTPTPTDPKNGTPKPDAPRPVNPKPAGVPPMKEG